MATVSHRRAVSSKHVLTAEIISVTSAMRKNSRWSSPTHFLNANRVNSSLGSNLGLRISSPSYTADPVVSPVKISREADLMGGFQDLKNAVREVEDVVTLPLPTILAPFFAIIRSPLSTGPITSAALSALHSFFVCGLISPESPFLEAALIDFSSTVSQCKFEASDSSGDEVVMFKIMTVIQDCLCGSVGRVLGDIEVCEMLETVLTTACQMRLSEILRRSAENTMHALVRTVFSRLHDLDPEEEEAKLRVAAEESLEGEIRMTVPTTPVAEHSTNDTGEDEESPAVEKDGDKDEEKDVLQDEKQPQESLINSSNLQDPEAIKRPEYGLPSILELLRVLINVLDPSDQQHTDSTRTIALGILNAAFEASGSLMPSFPSLEVLVLDSGCKFLFQLARSESAVVLQLALRTISTVFDTMRSHLKMQQELFIAFTIDRLAPPPLKHPALIKKGANSRPGTPVTPTLGPVVDTDSEKEAGTLTPSRVIVPPAKGETRDLILETLSQISKQSSFMVDLYANYDCDVNCENLFERLIDFLTKSVYSTQSHPTSDTRSQSVQYMCLDLLLAFVNDMAKRADGESEEWPSNLPPIEDLFTAKSRKKLVLTGASRFNAKPKSALPFLEETGLIYADLSPEVSRPQSLARFLKDCTRLDKRLLGDFISKPENIDVLTAFIELFDFQDKPIAEATRDLLEAFRLPGEAQQIARITETFAKVYFASKPAEIRSEDAVYVLAYSVILLNTDQHNPQVRKRMTIEDYSKNLRGVNDNQDFSPQYLQNIYDSIRKREIIMPEEHTGQLGFEHAWKELLARSRKSGDLIMCNTSLFDVEMFKLVWRPVISAIAYAFISFDDDYIIQRSIAGFRQCATLAGHFKLPDVFDFVVMSLSQATSLLSTELPAQVPIYPLVDVEGQSVTVSSLSVRFGTNFKGQLAAVVLYNIVNGNGNALREGWTQIFEMFQTLFLHSLLPTRMLQMEDFLGGVSMIPLRGSQPSRPPPRSDGGLLSALSSYLMTPYGSSAEALIPDATDVDIENTLCAIDCITSCRLDELYSQIMHLDLEALVAAVRALEALAHDRTVARLKQESDDGIHQSLDDEPFSLPYDPASVFLLETMVSIACQTPQHIEEIWPIVYEHLSALLSSSQQYSFLLIERAVVGLLRLCLLLARNTSLRDQIYVSFDLLSGLPTNIATAVAEQVISGVIIIVQEHRDIIRSPTEWNLVFAVIRSTIPHPEAARLAFDIIATLGSDGPQQLVTADNLTGLVTVLDDFASLAGATVEAQQQQRRRVPLPTAATSPAIERGIRAVDILSSLKKFSSPLIEASNLPANQAWRQLCLPLLISLGRQSSNAAREVRHVAISQLQRILLGPDVASDNSQVEEIFNRVIFPLLDELLKPQVFNRDARAMPETRLRASALLCKAFLHFEVRDSEASADFRLLWIQILDLLDRLMNIDKGDQLYEAVPESLKNVVLVMNAAGLLVPPPPAEVEDSRDERQRTLWTATQERVERFLPGFLAHVLAPPSAPIRASTPLPEPPA